METAQSTESFEESESSVVDKLDAITQRVHVEIDTMLRDGWSSNPPEAARLADAVFWLRIKHSIHPDDFLLATVVTKLNAHLVDQVRAQHKQNVPTPFTTVIGELYFWIRAIVVPRMRVILHREVGDKIDTLVRTRIVEQLAVQLIHEAATVAAINQRSSTFAFLRLWRALECTRADNVANDPHMRAAAQWAEAEWCELYRRTTAEQCALDARSIVPWRMRDCGRFTALYRALLPHCVPAEAIVQIYEYAAGPNHGATRARTAQVIQTENAKRRRVGVE